MKKINEYIFSRKVKKHLSHEPRKKRFVDYANAKTVLILFESDFNERNRLVRKIIAKLNADGKRVAAWGFLDTKKTNAAILPSFRILDQSTTNWYGCPKEIFVRELLETHFDLLIDLTLNEILPLKYVCLYANADLKTGMSRTMDDFLDFKISIPHKEEKNDEISKESNIPKTMDFKNINEILYYADQEFLFEQIVHYLKMIQSND